MLLKVEYLCFQPITITSSDVGDIHLKRFLGGGGIRAIGNLKYHYSAGVVAQIGDLRIKHDSDGLPITIGNMEISYREQGMYRRMTQIGDMAVEYDYLNTLLLRRIKSIGDIRFYYGFWRRIREIELEVDAGGISPNKLVVLAIPLIWHSLIIADDGCG